MTIMLEDAMPAVAKGEDDRHRRGKERRVRGRTGEETEIGWEVTMASAAWRLAGMADLPALHRHRKGCVSAIRSAHPAWRFMAVGHLDQQCHRAPVSRLRAMAHQARAVSQVMAVCHFPAMGSPVARAAPISTRVFARARTAKRLTERAEERAAARVERREAKEAKTGERRAGLHVQLRSLASARQTYAGKRV